MANYSADALGLKTKIVGVVAENAATYALVWDAAKAAGVADIALATDEK